MKNNNQQLIFCQSLLDTIKEGKPQQNKPFTIGCTEKHENIPLSIELYPNAVNCLPYRIITTAGEGIWQTWEDSEEIENTFRMLSII